MSSAPPIERLAVLGLGLLGGSVLLAARERGVAREVVIATRSAAARAHAVALGAAAALEDPAEAVKGAQFIVLATPVAAMEATLARAASQLSAGAVVTDVGSVKGGPCERLPGLLPPGVEFVGSHPMAGSHERGPDHARADLFEGAPCIVASRARTPAAARVRGFWAALGCRVVDREPAIHDAEVAWTSHVPHVLAFAFAAALRQAPAGAAELVGPGFRDFTRIARSQPGLWGDILAANRKALAGPLEGVRLALAEVSRAIEAEDSEAVERWIAQAQAALLRLLPADGSVEPAQRAGSKGARTTHHD